jgi:hypothetical protein
MAFLTDTLARAAFKRTLGKGHTSGSKDLSNEAETSFITIAARDIFADRIPTTPASAIAAGVSTSLVSLTLTLDPSSNGKAYLASIATVSGSPLEGKINPRTGAPFADTDRVGFLIPPQYGTDFRAILKNNGTEIAPSSAQDWFIDYVAGIVTSEDNLSLVNGTLEAYVYNGRYLDSVVITHDLFTTQADGYGVFAKGPGGTDGYSIVTNNVGIGTTTPSEKLTISTSANGGIAINNSSTNDPTLKFKLLNVDTFIAGIDNSDGDKFKIERGSLLGTNNDIVVNSTDGYVGLNVSLPTQRLHLNGSLRVGINNSETIISDSDLALGSEGSLLLVSDSSSITGTPSGDIIFGAGSANAASNATFASMFPASVPRREYMRIRASDGYVGIGTTIPSTNGRLTIANGNLSLLSGGVSVTGGNYIINNDNAYVGMDSQNNLFWSNTTGDGVLNFKSSGFINIDSNNNDADTKALFIGKNQSGSATSSNLVTIQEAGRVGIGTTNPDFKLTLHGSSGGATTFKANGILLRATNTSSAGEAVVAWQSDGPGNIAANYWMAGIDDTVSGLNFGYGTTFTNTSMIMHIGTDGYVGIGTTTPKAKMNVYDGYDSPTQTDFTQNLHSPGFLVTSDYVSGNFTPGLFWSTQDDNNTKPKAGIYTKLTASGSYLYFGTSNSYATGITNDAMVIRYDGNVGIGTTNPAYNLHIGAGTVTNSAQSKVALTNVTNNQRAAFVAKALDSGGVAVESIYEASGTEQRVILGAATNHEVQLRTNNTVRQTWLTTGEVGIGVTNPTERLEVSNGSSAVDIFVAKENTTNVFVLADGMSAPSANNSILTGATTAIASWKTPQDLDLAVRLSTYIHFEDFLLAEGHTGASLTNNEILSNGYLVKNSGATVDARSSGSVTLNHPGVVDMSVLTLNNYASLMWGGGSSFTVDTGQVFKLVGYFDIRTLNGADDQKFVFGVTSSITGDPGVIGTSDVVLIYDNTSSNWRSSVNGVLHTSSFTVATGWNKLEIQFTGGGSTVSFTINGSIYSRGSVTLPSATTDLYIWCGIKKVNGSTTTFTIGVDCIGFSISNITRG